MKVKQSVSVKYESAYVSYASLDLTDTDGDEVQIRLSDDQYIELNEQLTRKVERIQLDRKEKQEEQEVE